MRLIDAEALMKEANEEGAYGYVDVTQIANTPTIEAKPVVHGWWISKNNHGYEWIFVCSNCGYVDGYPFNDRHNYCPSCGAKMDEKED